MENTNFSKWYKKLERKGDFAAAIGYCKEHVSLVAGGKKPVSLKLARAVERYTGGKVKTAWLLGL